MIAGVWRWLRRRSAPVRIGLLVAGCLLIVGAPLIGDVLGMIPHPARRLFGHLAVAGLIAAGLWRLLTIRESDRWPEFQEPAPSSLGSAVALHAALLLLLLPLFDNADHLGRGDWDLACQWEEAIRQSILNWGQFPWWNPWVRGGFPLAGEPQVGVVSPTTPLVLAMGTAVGMRLSAVVHLLLAAEGMRRLALLCTGRAWPAAFAGFVVAANGCMLLYTSANPHIPLSWPFMPWMLYYCFRLGERLRDGLWLGLWTALSLLGVIQYLTAYGALAAACVWVRGLRVHWSNGRWRWLTHSVAAAGVVLLSSSWRLAVTGSILRDFPRELQTLWDVSVVDWVANLWTRPVDAPLDVPTIECCAYVGPIVILLTLLSFRSGWRWWHWMMLCGFVLSLGAYRWHHLSYWLSSWPGFSTMHVVTRWRLIAIVGMAIAGADVLGRLWSSGRRPLRFLALAGAAAVAVDYGQFAWEVLPRAFSIPAKEEFFPGPAVRRIPSDDGGGFPINIERWEWPPGAFGTGDQTLGFACTQRGYGVIRGNEPQMGYDRGGPTARLWIGHPNYVGEHVTQDGTPVHPAFWSPNRIVFHVEPHQTVWINQNPGSWWTVNGERPFAKLRCAEWELPLMVQANAQGIVELQIRPRGLELGVALSAFGGCLVVLTIVLSRRRRSNDVA